MNATEKLELQVEETQDGSAVVQLPDNDPHPEDAQTDVQDDEPAQQMTTDQDVDPEREAIRQARREERQLKKQLHRERARESNHLINALRKQNQELAERLSLVEKRTSGAELARVEKAIDDAAVQVEYAKMKIADAINSQDGSAVAKAQETWFEARRKLESLQAMKDAAARQTQQPVQSLPDPTVKEMAARWVERNPWYDPQGKNIESTIAQKIDHQLHSEGFDPTSEDYWEELDERLKKYVPQSQNSGYNARTSQPEKRRSTMTSSGRDSMPAQRAGEFILSPERVAAMKEAGLWDNPQLRQRAIDKYRTYDRQNRNQRT